MPPQPPISLTIFVFVNGCEKPARRFQLTAFDLKAYNPTLDSIARRLGLRATGIKSLYTLSGGEVKRPHDLQDGGAYVAVSSIGKFRRRHYFDVDWYKFNIELSGRRDANSWNTSHKPDEEEIKRCTASESRSGSPSPRADCSNYSIPYYQEKSQHSLPQPAPLSPNRVNYDSLPPDRTPPRVPFYSTIHPRSRRGREKLLDERACSRNVLSRPLETGWVVQGLKIEKWSDKTNLPDKFDMEEEEVGGFYPAELKYI